MCFFFRFFTANRKRESVATKVKSPKRLPYWIGDVVHVPMMFRNCGFIHHLKGKPQSRYPYRRIQAGQVVLDFLHQRSCQTGANNLGSIYHPPSYEHPNKELLKSLRSCMTGMHQDDHESYTKDTGMSLCFLGTGAGTPTRQRSTTSTLLRLGGSSMLFDAGEGVQRQLLFTRAKPSHIERIFITHLHGDHIFGLPGFLLGLQTHIMAKQKDVNILKNKRKREAMENHAIKIYGPRTLFIKILGNSLIVSNFWMIQLEYTITLLPTSSCLVPSFILFL